MLVCLEIRLGCVGCGGAVGHPQRLVVVGGGQWLPLLVGRSPVVLLQGPGLLGVWLVVSLVADGGVVALGDFVGGACPAVALCRWVIVLGNAW